MLETRTTAEGIVFSIYVQPRASANAVSGLHENAVKIRLTAPPVDNAANKMCIKFLSGQLKIPASRMEIIAGHAGRNKKVLIRFPDGSDAKQAAREINGQLQALVGGE